MSCFIVLAFLLVVYVVELCRRAVASTVLPRYLGRLSRYALRVLLPLRML